MTTKTKTSEKPILFSAPMVRALLDGLKTMTRRVVKPQPPKWIDKYAPTLSPIHWMPSGVYIKDPGGFLGRGALQIRQNYLPVKCPYKVGDRLWVRETWCMYGSDAIYRANYGEFTPISDGIGGPWKPSIFMPRKLSRITLEITGVRVERIQEITRLDCVAEGWPHDTDPAHHPLQIQQARDGLGDEVIDDSSICWFADLWDSINGKRPGCSWSDNPFCWCIEFKRVTEPAF